VIAISRDGRTQYVHILPVCSHFLGRNLVVAVFFFKLSIVLLGLALLQVEFSCFGVMFLGG
jgi:hypothetical protein